MCCCLSLLLLGTRAETPTCNVEHSFRVNEVFAGCKEATADRAANPGAMPFRTKSAMSYDFRRLNLHDDRVSLVLSSWGTHVVCSDLHVNRPGASSSTSGHMRPIIVPNSTLTVVSIRSADSTAAAKAMHVGVYDVCFFDGNAWANTGIALEVQQTMLGVEMLDLLHGDGARAAVPLDTRYHITLSPKFGPGLSAASGDRIAVVLASGRCSDANVTRPATQGNHRPTAIANLEYSEERGGFLGASAFPDLAAFWYQICFSRNGSDFFKTGVAVLVQSDIAAVQVNGIMPNLGIDVSSPPVRKVQVRIHRIVPPLGYHQIVQNSEPVALFSFEDQRREEMADNHCGQLCPAMEYFHSGTVANGARGSIYRPAAGLYNYLVANGHSTHAYTLSSMAFSSFAFTVIFAFQWQHRDGLGDRMEILSPYRVALDDWQAGFVSVSLRTDPDNQADLGQRRRLQLQILGFSKNDVDDDADTLLFNHQFEKNVWYFAAITLDMNGDRKARLYVNGQPEPNPTAHPGFKENERKAQIYGDASRFQLAPASIAAFHDTISLQNVFLGFLDEVGLFNKALAPANILRQYEARSMLSSIFPRDGYTALVPPTEACESASSYRRDQIIKYSATSQVGDLLLLDQADIDSVLPQLNPGHFHICFTRDYPTPAHGLATWYPSGASFRIQNDVMGLSVNGVQHARGLKSFMPRTGTNVVEIMRHSSLQVPGKEAIALIPASASCSSVPDVCSANTSGHLSSIRDSTIMLWGDLCEGLQPTIYQICHKRANVSIFHTTGLSLTLQDIVSSAYMNDIMMGDGRRLAAPKVSTNRILFSVNSENSTGSALSVSRLVRLIGDRRVDGDNGKAWDEADVYISVIPAMADCEDPAENPNVSAPITIQGQSHMRKSIFDGIWGMGEGKNESVVLRTSGHLLTAVELAYDGNVTYPAAVYLDEDPMWAGISNLPTGPYQICMCVFPKPIGQDKIFTPTGIGLDIQNRIDAMRVNFLIPNKGVRLRLPRNVGNRIWISDNRPNASNFTGFAMSLIQPQGDCGDFRDAPPLCNNSSQNDTSRNTSISNACSIHNGSHISGLMPLAENGMVMDTQQLSQMEPGLYQVCVQKLDEIRTHAVTAPGLGSTGISVSIHEDIWGFQSNGITPGKGTRVSLPLVPGNTLSYVVPSASAVHWISIIRADQECRRVAENGTGALRLLPKPSWRLRGRYSFSVTWYTSGSEGEVLLTLQAHCYNEVPVNCSADHGYLVSMRSRQLIANDSTATSKLVWGVYENVSYPGNLPMDVDWTVTVEDYGFSLSWEGKVQHIYPHRIPWSRFNASVDGGRVEVIGSVMATIEERTSDRRYEIKQRDVNKMAATLPPGIYQVCFSREGAASSTSVFGESDVALGTGISLRLHQLLTGIEINGIAFYPRRHPQGIVATAPVRKGLLLRALGSSFNASGKLKSSNNTLELALSLIAPDGDCGSVDAGSDCVDGSCDNPRRMALAQGASGLLSVNFQDSSLNSVHALGLLPSGIYQICLRKKVISPGQVTASRSVFTEEFVATGISMELQTRIGGIWVNDNEIHDGLHSAASRRNFNTIYIRGSVVVDFNLRKSVPVSGRIALLPAAPAASALPWWAMTCARLSKSNVPYFELNSSDDFITQGSWDAAWGFNGSESPGLYELCHQGARDELYASTGIAIDLLPAPREKIASLMVNGVQSWSVSAVPFGVERNEILFEIAGGSYHSNMYFALARESSCQDQASQAFPPKIPTHNAGLEPTLGRWNTSEVDEIWSSPVGGAFGDRMDLGSGTVTARFLYKVCFSDNGNAGPWVDTGLTVYGQRNVTKMTLNHQFLQDGRILYLAQIPNARLAFEVPPNYCSAENGCDFLPRPYAVGDAVTLITLQGNCSNVIDNPIATTGGSSGAMYTRKNDGVLDYNTQLQGLGVHRYQVCVQGADESTWHATGIRVDVLLNYSLSISGMPQMPARSDVNLPALTVRLETPSGTLVPYFDSTAVILSLYRCKSTCGTLINSLSSCSEACGDSEWENSTEYLMGGQSLLTNGETRFRSIAVRSNAGRFYLKAAWARDQGRSSAYTENFIVLPHHIETDGVEEGDQYVVQAAPLTSFQACDTGLLSREDVRCRGNAILPPIRVRVVDSRGETLHMLREQDGFRVVSELWQGLDGVWNYQHSRVPFSSDLIMAGWIETGGLRENETFSSPTPGGFANFSGPYGLQIRRLAGTFFKVHFSLVGDDLSRDFLKVDTKHFGIVPGIYKVHPWSFAVAADRPRQALPHATERQMVQLPDLYMELQDGSGHRLEHADCKGCVMITNGLLSEDAQAACEYFGIPSPDPACAQPIWTQRDASRCRKQDRIIIGLGEKTLDECKQVTISRPKLLDFPCSFLSLLHVFLPLLALCCVSF